MNYRFLKSDLMVLIFLSVFISFIAFEFVDFTIAPFEDAAMLMRYSDHFAHGYGIVWNIGEKPVDGATDFLFMFFLGLLVKVGIPLEFATQSIGFSSHVITVWIVYIASRKFFYAKQWLALVYYWFKSGNKAVNYAVFTQK